MSGRLHRVADGVFAAALAATVLAGAARAAPAVPPSDARHVPLNRVIEAQSGYRPPSGYVPPPQVYQPYVPPPRGYGTMPPPPGYGPRDPPSGSGAPLPPQPGSMDWRPPAPPATGTPMAPPKPPCIPDVRKPIGPAGSNVCP